MFGTEELGAKNGAEKLAALLERVTSLQLDTSRQNTLLDKINATVTDIQLANVASRERLTALDARVEHNRTVSDAHDLEQVRLIREEHDGREAAMAERRRAHDADVAGINTKIDTITKQMADVLVTNRILIFVASGIALAIIGGVVSGHISFVVTP